MERFGKTEQNRTSRASDEVLKRIAFALLGVCAAISMAYGAGTERPKEHLTAASNEMRPATVRIHPGLPLRLDVDRNDTHALWPAVANAFRGTYDQKRDCWIFTIPDADERRSFCMRPHRISLLQDFPGRIMLTTAGVEIGEDGVTYDCHACAGASGFFIFDERENTLFLSAALPLARFGAWGEVPPASAYRAIRIGKSAWGWIVTMTYNNRGTLVRSHLLFGEHKGRLALLGVLPAGVEPEDGKPDAPDNYRYNIHFDESDPAAPLYPVILEASGRRDRAIHQSRLVIPFDMASDTYRFETSDAYHLDAVANVYVHD